MAQLFVVRGRNRYAGGFLLVILLGKKPAKFSLLHIKPPPSGLTVYPAHFIVVVKDFLCSDT